MTRKITIEIGQTHGPKSEAWWACFGEYDYAEDTGGPSLGTGPTKEAAIIDLVSNHDLPDDDGVKFR